MSGLLLVLAHPDDEVFLGGGALAYYARRGISTAYLCFTLGQAGRRGVTGRPPLATAETIGEVRRDELQRAVRILGIGELIAPGWMDGTLAEIPDEDGARFIAGHIRRLRPEILISFGAEGAPSGHADHKATWRWTRDAFTLADDSTFDDGRSPFAPAKHYAITWPSLVDHLRGRSGGPITTILDLGEDVARCKRAAFDQHATQHDHGDLYHNLQDGLDGKEHFHLAQSRVGQPAGLERDLFERIVRS